MKCPFCGEGIQDGARSCRHCGESFGRSTSGSRFPAGSSPSDAPSDLSDVLATLPRLKTEEATRPPERSREGRSDTTFAVLLIGVLTAFVAVLMVARTGGCESCDRRAGTRPAPVRTGDTAEQLPQAGPKRELLDRFHRRGEFTVYSDPAQLERDLDAMCDMGSVESCEHLNMFRNAR